MIEPDSYRTVEVRLHCGRDTLFGSLLVQVAPASSWPASVTLPTGPQLYRLLISKHRFESYVDINDCRAWSFTWDESAEWRVEEFLWQGSMWRLEYRTRYPELAAP